MEEVLTMAAAESAALGIWFLVGAALVFFMQAGFCMLEAGLTRAKNAGNIIMKNTMDFSIGTLVFLFIGYSLMCGDDVAGFVGSINTGQISDFASFDWANFFFQLVFCATAATIVSGTMAERTKFSAYLIYSIVISAFIYPIEAHWVWGGGFLSTMGYVDWAGSSVIHMVGGIFGLIGAIFVGPRIGKYNADGTPNAIEGHSLTLASLGVFILWFGWYGFNGAAAGSSVQLAQILATTTIAAALGAISAMIYTWATSGKPDVSMTLNGAIAGLVGITAGTANLDAVGSLLVGIICGLVVAWFIPWLDRRGVDDPVGAVGVHGVAGLLGTLLVGLLASPAVDPSIAGLFYGGGFSLLGVQALGVLAIGAWTAAGSALIFALIKVTIGIRVSADEELEGLDISEHGLMSAYADFVPTLPAVASESAPALDLSDLVSSPVNTISSTTTPTKVTILCNKDEFVVLKDTLAGIGISGMTVTTVMGCGVQSGRSGHYRGVTTKFNLLPKFQIDIVVSEIDPGLVVAVAKKVLHTGNSGDGKVFISGVSDVVRLSTGETGAAALKY